MARVLVVDDVPDLRRVYALLLAATVHEAITVSDGAAALKAISEDPPDLVLLDLMMPDLEGFSVLAALRKCEQSGCRVLPVIVLSALDDERSRSRAAELGAVRYFVKGRVKLQSILGQVAHLAGSSDR